MSDAIKRSEDAIVEMRKNSAMNKDGEIRAIALGLIAIGSAEIKDGKQDLGMKIIDIANDLLNKIHPRITN